MTAGDGVSQSCKPPGRSQALPPRKLNCLPVLPSASCSIASALAAAVPSEFGLFLNAGVRPSDLLYLGLSLLSILLRSNQPDSGYLFFSGIGILNLMQGHTSAFEDGGPWGRAKGGPVPINRKVNHEDPNHLHCVFDVVGDRQLC